MDEAVCDRVVAKMQCHGNKGEASLEPHQAAYIELGAVYEYAQTAEERMQKENAIFGHYTPYGEVKLGIANPVAAAFFKPGKKYYVTFAEAPD